MTGGSKVLSASRIATEVWVKAAGLIDDAARDLARLVDPVDDLVLAVALVEAQLELAARPRACGSRASTSASVSWP